LNTCAERLATYTSWKEKAERNGFIVVWPQGTFNLFGQRGELGKSSWNAGLCCAPASAPYFIDDVGFLRKVVSQTASNHGVDLSRVYMAGHSNGCSMAQRMAAEASDIVAAVGCHSSYLAAKSQDFIPVPIMEIHGDSDPIVPYGLPLVGAKANQQRWRDLNKCQGSATETSDNSYTSSTYSNCQGGTEVTLVTVKGAGHSPYQGFDTRVDTTQLAWDFVKRFSRSPDDKPYDDEKVSPAPSPAPDLPPTPELTVPVDGNDTLVSCSVFPMSKVSWYLVALFFGSFYLQA
jgi:poly(3-hydroxybutyrate) depolymerase